MVVRHKALCFVCGMICLTSLVAGDQQGPENIVSLFNSTVMLECKRDAMDEVDWTYWNITAGHEDQRVHIRKVTTHYRKETSGNGVHRLYINNLQFSDSGRYVCRSSEQESSSFNPQAAQVVTVAHHPTCESKPSTDRTATLICWIAYAGGLDVRLVWSGPGPDGAIVDEKNFTALASGISVHGFSVQVPVNPFHVDEYYCRVNFFIMNPSSDMKDVASNVPNFTDVCYTTNKPVAPCNQTMRTTSTEPTIVATDVGDELSLTDGMVAQFNSSVCTCDICVVLILITMILFLIIGGLAGFFIGPKIYGCCKNKPPAELTSVVANRDDTGGDEEVKLPLMPCNASGPVEKNTNQSSVHASNESVSVKGTHHSALRRRQVSCVSQVDDTETFICTDHPPVAQTDSYDSSAKTSAEPRDAPSQGCEFDLRASAVSSLAEDEM